MSRTTVPSRRSSQPASTWGPCSGSSSWWTATNTSDGRPRRGSRLRDGRSGAIGGCRSPIDIGHGSSRQPATACENAAMTVRGLIFDFGGVLWDMRWDASAELEREHELRERALPETLYTGEIWRQLEVGVGDRDQWLTGAHAELEAVAGKPLPPLHQQWRERQHLIVQNIELIRRMRGLYRMSVLSNADL